MSTEILTRLEDFVEAVQIRDADSFTFASVAYHQNPPISADTLRSPLDNPLITRLRYLLYDRCYCQPYAPDQEAHPPFGALDDDFIRRLSDADGSRFHWESGWVVKKMLESGRILVEKNRTMKVLNVDAPIGTGIEGSPVAGSEITIRLQNETTTTQPGFYIIWGDAPMHEADGIRLLRFYFNLQPEGAPRLIALLVQQLNHFQIPFQFKCLGNPHQYYRRDAGVLYILKPYYRMTASLLGTIHQEIAPHLDDGVPLFTRRLARGLGLAEDPGGNNSFGMHRCGVLARGLWGAYLLGFQNTEDRCNYIRQQFISYGIPLERVHLNPGSRDDYLFPISHKEGL